MNWLTNHYFGEGPGIAKDAPKPTGLRLLWSVFGREWWELIKLNLLFLIFALPLVTLPAATIALAAVTLAMIEDRNVWLLKDFWAAFRSRFVATTALGLAFVALLCLSGLALVTYTNAVRDNLWFAPLMVVAAFITILLPIWASHFAVALVLGRSEPLGTILKVATIGFLARPLPGFLALAFVAALWGVHILFYPASVFMPVLVNFSLGALVMNFAVYRGVLFGFSHFKTSSQHSKTGSPETQSA